MTPARRCVCVISINLSIPLGGGAEEKLQVWIRTRPAPAYPTSIATLHDEAIAQMAIALRLITLAFGLLHSVHERAHSPSLGTGGSNPALSSGKSANFWFPSCDSVLRLLPAGANRRVGLAPTGKRRLVTAHPHCGHPAPPRRSTA